MQGSPAMTKPPQTPTVAASPDKVKERLIACSKRMKTTGHSQINK